ncbi:hypothetical protein TNCV_2146631 [Trichonephila clavipes]|uniref:Uncharacterized protein n=1 Tax=Trichonephila clavipes TaxID=2585209 RepID=A0A8X6VSL2_TRICX|nr:hypothetical protein TNCV_2146631 [Trichonephila clavipes]
MPYSRRKTKTHHQELGKEGTVPFCQALEQSTASRAVFLPFVTSSKSCNVLFLSGHKFSKPNSSKKSNDPNESTTKRYNVLSSSFAQNVSPLALNGSLRKDAKRFTLLNLVSSARHARLPSSAITKFPSSASSGKLPNRTTQPTFCIGTLTSTFDGLKEDTCTKDSLTADQLAESSRLFMAWSADCFTEY